MLHTLLQLQNLETALQKVKQMLLDKMQEQSPSEEDNNVATK